MAEKISGPRAQAEIAFNKTQSNFLARNRAQEEHDSVAQARDAKTLRLREARKAKESDARTATDAAENSSGKD